MTNPMLAELDAVVRLGNEAYVEGKAYAYQDATVRALNFVLDYHATLADMAKRLEAAERDAADARRYRSIKDTYGGWQSIGGIMQADIRTPIWRGDWPSFDAAIDAAAREGEG